MSQCHYRGTQRQTMVAKMVLVGQVVSVIFFSQNCTLSGLPFIRGLVYHF